MEKLDIKAQARKLIDKLPDNSTWDDLMYEIYVRQVVEAGLNDKMTSRRSTTNYTDDRRILSKKL
jgi:hypothetical protein